MHRVCVLLVWVVILEGAVLVTPVCKDADSYVDTSTLICVECGARDPSLELNRNKTGCWCKRGYASTGRLTTPFCEDCVAAGMTSDTLRLTCIPCATDLTLGLDTTTRDCKCATNGALTDQIEGQYLAEKVCTDCTIYNATAAPKENSTELINERCVVPSVCPDGARETTFSTEANPVCLPTDTLSAVGSPGGALTYGDNSVSSTFLAEQAVIAGTRCASGLTGANGCSYLANLCVLQLYDITQGACRVYYELLTQTCTPPTCLIPTALPWLLYQESDEDVVQSNVLKRVIEFESSLDLVVNVYNLHGTLESIQEVTNIIFFCEIAEPIAVHGLKFGNNIMSTCKVNTDWIQGIGINDVSVVPPEPKFYELFVRDVGNRTVAVPVRYGGDSGDDFSIFYDDPPSRNFESTLYRRFALFENLLSPTYGRFLKKITVLVGMNVDQEDTIYAPVVTLEYDFFEKATTPATATAGTTFTIGEDVLPQPHSKTVLRGGEKSSTQIFYVTNHSNEAILALMIASCCVAFMTSLVKAWAFQRRMVSPYVDLFAVLFRWFVYYCSHFAAYFFIVLTGASLWYFFWFKGQSSASVLLPPPAHISHYFTALLWTSFCCRFVDVAYRVYEQCNMWVFFLDWEQPRGRLVSENKDLPVSMWRLVFAANAFNQLQAVFSLKIYATVLLTLVLLEAFGLQGLTTAQPDGNDLSLEGSFSHPILRTALTIIVWYGIMFVLWLWDVTFFHRFLSAHPVREFVDLLSLVNVSMFILLERRHGYYIHGKSVHQFCEASVREFQGMLKKEEDGAIPMRGLTGQSDRQTFEILIDDGLANMLFETQNTIMRDRMTLGVAQHPPRRCYEYIMGMSSGGVLSQNVLRCIQELNKRLMGVVMQVVEEVQMITPLHRSLGVVPMVFPSMPTRFYQQTDSAWTKCTLHHLEFSISNLALLFYLAIDYSFQNAFVAASVAFVIIYVFQIIRKVFGSSNLAKKTMLDERFFL